MKKAWWLILVCLGWLGLSGAEAASYIITDLGTLGGSNAMAYGINSQGWVAGTAETAAGEWHAFLWKNGVMQDLGTLPGYSEATAFGVNNSGQVVGMANNPGTAQRAFLWDGSMQDLGVLSGYTNSWGLAINNLGQAVGNCYNYVGGPQAAFCYDPLQKKIEPLPPLTGHQSSEAYGINNLGQVAGSSSWGPTPTRAVVWTQRVPQDLGVLPGTAASYGRGLNDVGQVTGTSEYTRGVDYTQKLFIWENGAMVELLTLSHDFVDSFTGMPINSGGQFATTLVSGAVLWKGGMLQPLNRLISPCSGWSLWAASALNDAGQIAGYGRYKNNCRAYLLTPGTPPPCGAPGVSMLLLD